MGTEYRIKDTEDSEKWESREVREEKLFSRYNVHYVGNGYPKPVDILHHYAIYPWNKTALIPHTSIQKI